MKKLNEFFRNKQLKTVLDVGTGSGNFIAVLKETLFEAKITGVDPNVESLKEAAEIYPEVIFQEMVGEELFFANNTFDAASISMALHHLPNVSKALGEMQRVVKTGGWIMVNELFSDNLNPAQEVHKMMHHFRSKIDRLKGIAHHETFTRQEILELVENSGLEICLHFENHKTRKQPTSIEINERKEKMIDMLNEIKHLPEYQELSQEIPEIEIALSKYGFEMAPRVVIIAEVK